MINLLGLKIEGFALSEALNVVNSLSGESKIASISFNLQKISYLCIQNKSNEMENKTKKHKNPYLNRKIDQDGLWKSIITTLFESFDIY